MLSIFSSGANILPDSQQVRDALRIFDYLGGDEELDRAMAACSRRLEDSSTLRDPLQRTKWRILEASALYLRYERDGHIDDMEEAKDTLEALLQSDSIDDSHMHAYYGLGRIYEAHFDNCGSLESMKKAKDVYRQALALSITTDSASALSDVIIIHLARQLANLSSYGEDNLSEAIDLLRDVVERTEDSNPAKVHALAYLSTAYFRRFSHSSRESREDVEESVHLVRRALHLGPYHRYRSRFLIILAYIYMHWDKPHHLQEGIELAKQAMDLLTSLPPFRHIDGTVLHSLAHGYATKFELEGRLADLDRSLEYSRILASDPEHPSHAPSLSDLCLFLCLRFEATGRLIDIDSAIEAGHRALKLSSTQPLRAVLGKAHLLRYAACHESEDFNEAQVQLEQGLQITKMPSLHPLFYHRLALLYCLRFDMSGEPMDLELVLENGGKAVDLCNRKDPDEEASGILSAHGMHLLKRFQLHSSPRDLAESILLQEKALKLASIGFHQRHMFLWRYGHALRLRLTIHQDSQDSTKCEQVLREALEIAVMAHLPKQTVYLTELAALFCARMACSFAGGNGELAVTYYSRAAGVTEGHIDDRIQAALTGARLAHELGWNEQSARLFAEAISFLPRIAWLGLNASNRHEVITQTASQLACDAAASAIRIGKFEHAVELLDEGRSVMWRSILELRTDFRLLEETAPKLVRELLEVAEALEHDDLSLMQIPESHMEERSARRRRRAERWEELVLSVRELEGFHSFLKPLAFARLQQAARDGPVVLLNVSNYGSHALIVSSMKPIQIVPIPGLDYRTVRRHAFMLVRALGVARDRNGHNLLETVLMNISRRLWHGGIAAVAAEVTDCRGQLDRPLHIWWIPTGYLGLLPIHCAGPYEGGRPGVPELFISSYTTTLSALLMAQKPGHSGSEIDEPKVSDRMLAIGVPELPDHPGLPYAYDETQVVANVPGFGDSSSLLFGADATFAAVTSALPEHNWIHACCHGHYDPVQPLHSGFNLVDGSLTLAQVVQMRLRHADLAFLSACHTARHATQVPDESMHLAAGLQVAGFRGVVGTVWAMVDRDGPVIAQRFYHWLTLDGRPPDARNAAEALHMATRDFRRMGMPLYRWAAFVHFGV